MSSFLQNFHALYVYQVFHNISGDGGYLHIEIQTNKFKRWILCFLKTLGFSDMVPRHSQHPHSLLPFQANNHDSKKKQLKNIPPIFECQRNSISPAQIPTNSAPGQHRQGEVEMIIYTVWWISLLETFSYNNLLNGWSCILCPLL